MKKLFGLLVCAALLFSCKDEPAAEDNTGVKAPADAGTASKDYEIGDTKYVDLAKAGVANLASGDIDTWMTSFADNAIYRWNNLDSLIGKPAIVDYWKKRRSDAIDTMSFSGDVWMPVKVLVSQGGGQLTGNYALCWQLVHAKYKTGKSMTQRVHTIYHFDDNDKIDRVLQYLDRAPIIAAMAN